MPVTYQIDSEINLVTFTAYGVLSEHEYTECRARLVQDPGFHPGMNQIADFHAVDEQIFTQEGHDHFIEQEVTLKPMLGNYRQAIVAYSDLHFGLARQVVSELGESPEHTQVFYSIEEAQAWLLKESNS